MLTVHVAFYVAAGAVALGIVILASAHKLLAEAEPRTVEDRQEEAPAEELGSAS